ncbi:MAG: diaminopimelate epimerase, partial [Gammaproteobacteria bacterium]|nr:diaminopimelate epimerase [Gammaproteobacteria bacterium]
MKAVPFVKYTSFGNNFVILDELGGELLSEEEKSQFAHQATNTCFGIGCDNLLVVQRSDRSTLERIAAGHPHWSSRPSSRQADVIFRMFEPDGSEALSCGNGLMSIARFLRDEHGVRNARIMTEVPLANPSIVRIGTDNHDAGWVDLGAARCVPESVCQVKAESMVDQVVAQLPSLDVTVREHDLKPYTDALSLKVSGYLVFTGEPHVVIFPHRSFGLKTLAQAIFGGTEGPVRRRLSVGSWLVRRISSYFNQECSAWFPHGINVNFAQVIDRNVVEYRCYERGIYRETLACG